MPAYNTQPPVAIYPGDSFTLFNAETLTAPVASQQVAIGPSVTPGEQAKLSISLKFATSPTDAVNVQAANVDADANYVTIATSTNTSPDLVFVSTAAPFLRVQLSSQSGGGALTALVSRMA